MTRRRHPAGPARAWLGSVCVAALSVSLPGCADGGEPAPPTGEHALAPQHGTVLGAHAVDQVRVGLTEWTIVTSATHVASGEITFVVTNTGATQHDLVVRGRRGRWHSAHLAPGARTRLSVTAQAGEQLALWCSLSGHEAQGMHTIVRAQD